MDWKEEIQYRAETDRTVFIVYRRTMSRLWAWYAVNKTTKVRVAKDDGYTNAEAAKEAAEEGAKRIA